MLSVPLTVTVGQEDGCDSSGSSTMEEYDHGDDDGDNAANNATKDDGALGEGMLEIDLDSYRIKSRAPISPPLPDSSSARRCKNGGDAKSSDGGEREGSDFSSRSSIGETFQFVFGCGRSVTLLFAVGALGAAFNGLVYPALAFVLSNSFSSLSNAQSNGLSAVNQIAYSFLAVGGLALVAGLAQNWAFELVAYHASQNYRKQVRSTEYQRFPPSRKPNRFRELKLDHAL